MPARHQSPHPTRRGAERATPVDELPVEPSRRSRPRTRRGGPRTPLPLLPLLGIIAGVGIAYVSQSAHTTQATYRAAALAAEQQQLRADNQKAGDELDGLQSSARIVGAATQMGMRPAARWSYVIAAAPPVAAPAPQLADAPSGPTDPVQRLLATLGGQFGTSDARAATP